MKSNWGKASPTTFKLGEDAVTLNTI